MTQLPKPLIRAKELAALDCDPNVVIVDCRHQLLDPDAGERSFIESHIPGARHAHLDRHLSREPHPDEGRHPLPSPEAFAQTLGRLGISNDSAVVAYDDGGANIAGRLWWMLRWAGHAEVSILDGGFSAWHAAGLPVETGAVRVEPGRYVLDRVHSEWVVGTQMLRDMLASDAGVLIDVRTTERFEGRAEPIDPVAGHIPGAINLPGGDLQTASGEFQAPDVIRARVRKVLGNRPASAAVAMCGSGVTACQLLLAMEVAGLKGGRLYPGSWSEWIRDRARSIATGPVD